MAGFKKRYRSRSRSTKPSTYRKKRMTYKSKVNKMSIRKMRSKYKTYKFSCNVASDTDQNITQMLSDYLNRAPKYLPIY